MDDLERAQLVADLVAELEPILEKVARRAVKMEVRPFVENIPIWRAAAEDAEVQAHARAQDAKDLECTP